MRPVYAAFFVAALFAAAPAWAQTACGPLMILNIVHMLPTLSGDADIIPIVIAGKPHNFLFDTGGYYSQLSRPLAGALGLSIHQGEQEMFDVAGNISQDQARLPAYTLGESEQKDTVFMISPSLGRGDFKDFEGILALDQLVNTDAELDFSTDTLNLFSPDHCPGHVAYWNPPALSVVPFTLQRPPLPFGRLPPDMRGANIFVPVMLDGHQVRALIDTGATNTALRADEAERLYGLTMGSADTPENGALNGNAALKTYTHQFKSLSFGDVKITDLTLSILPNAMGRKADLTPLVRDRTRTERDLVNEPELILGMDVLRRLHLYIAFQEKKIYVSPPSLALPPGATVQPYSPEFLTAMLARLDKAVAANPNDANTLNDRCFWRAIAKTDLDMALADCDKSLTLAPRAATMDSRAFVLFQQGKYPDALAGYDAALAAEPNLAPSLWMRGLIKGKLGDAAGKTADMASATKIDPNIAAEFKRIGITPD